MKWYFIIIINIIITIINIVINILLSILLIFYYYYYYFILWNFSKLILHSRLFYGISGEKTSCFVKNFQKFVQGKKLFEVSAVFGAFFQGVELSTCKNQQCTERVTDILFTNKTISEKQKKCSMTILILNKGKNFIRGFLIKDAVPKLWSWL